MQRQVLSIFFFALCALVQPVYAGSLYQADTYTPLVSDRHAYRKGDNITVLIVETAKASATANTATNKDGSLGASVGGTRKTITNNYSGNVDLNETFKGGGAVTRSGNLLAQITVTVESVEDSGYLVIKGEQTIALNNEKQHIFLEGKVRDIDIAADNTVLSTRISNAQITYVGKGVLGEKQREGILTRLFTWLRIL